ncbi:MAG: mechanosensitive ion channel family protein [Gemmatimonadota bacterium]
MRDWLAANMPGLLNQGPLGIEWWQWASIGVLVVAATAIGRVVGRIVAPLAHRIVARTPSRWDDAILLRVAGPLAALLSLVVFGALLSLINLGTEGEATLGKLLQAVYFALFFWTLWRLIDVGRDVVSATHWAATAPSSGALVPLATRIFKVIVLAVAAVAVLSMLGYPVASLLAGLGLGGLALALGAQKTLENLFGAFAIGADQPFREGDVVKVEDFTGTVERIGLRSTRFRTADRTLITLPNGRLADMRVESLSARDRFHLGMTVQLASEATPAQVRQVLAGFEGVLSDHVRVWPTGTAVRLRDFTPNGLVVEVQSWFQALDFEEFRVIRQEVLLSFMDVVERAGTSMAFTRPAVVIRDRADESAGTAALVAATPAASPDAGQRRMLEDADGR